MKVKEIVEVISSLIVVVEGLKYKERICSVDVECLASSILDKETLTFTPISASCKDPYFVMGGSFWKENFGTRQANRIRKICDVAIKDYILEQA